MYVSVGFCTYFLFLSFSSSRLQLKYQREKGITCNHYIYTSCKVIACHVLFMDHFYPVAAENIKPSYSLSKVTPAFILPNNCYRSERKGLAGCIQIMTCFRVTNNVIMTLRVSCNVQDWCVCLTGKK